MVRADLHVHSTLSDGSFTREQILQHAAGLGLTHIAFTDHDTTDGVEDTLKMGQAYGITVLPAIEISAYDFGTNKKVHILGYNFKSTSHLNALCNPILERRNENSMKQIGVLETLGYQIEMEKIAALSSGCIYKQHILAYLLSTNQTEELFGTVYKNIFKNKGPCDFDIEYVSAFDAVKAVKEDGGTAVLAHPAQQDNFSLVPALIECGLDGIERNHPANDEAARERIDVLCRQFGLIQTGGSDFHGAYEAAPSPLGSNLLPKSAFVFTK